MNETRHPKRRTVGMALYGDLTYDSRVRREAATLARAGYEVSLACLGAEGGQRDDLPADVKVLVLEPTATSVLPGSEIPFSGGRSGRLVTILGRVKWGWAYARNVRAWGRSVVAALGPQDVWHLHDLTALAAVAPQLEQHVPVIYDAHELYLDTGTSLNLPGLARSAASSIRAPAGCPGRRGDHRERSTGRGPLAKIPAQEARGAPQLPGSMASSGPETSAHQGCCRDPGSSASAPLPREAGW